MLIDVKFKIGEVVYLLTDRESCPRVVLGYEVRSGSYTNYILSNGDMNEVYACEVEITKQKVFF